jgi:hypothetical protein
LARGFRFYEKKRGNRRTGSKTVGSAGEALFFAVFFLVGCVGVVVLFATLVIPEWRVNHEFVPHRCLVRKTRLAEKKSRLAEKPGSEMPSQDDTRYRPEFQIEYQIQGETYRLWTYDIWTLDPEAGFSADKATQQAILERFPADPKRLYDCWYDPSDPKVAILVRRSHEWIWLTFIAPICFILLGGAGLIYTAFTWGKSAERRSALARRAAQLAPFEDNDRSKSQFPNVPDCSKITDSPGTTLAFRLPVAAAPVWGIVASLLACVLWNSIVAILVVIAVNCYLQGRPDWIFTLFILPFVGIGIGLIVFFIRQLIVATGVGLTLVEVSHHPLIPSQGYRLFVHQAGRLKIKRIEVLLVCEEEATYRHGTDARTETREVYCQSLFTQSDFEVKHGLPFEVQCDLEVPAGSMHSFQSPHNEINWKIVVRGDVADWPSYRRSFPLIVFPGIEERANIHENGKCTA